MLSKSQAHYDYYILLGINELYTSEQRALCDKQKGPRYRAIRRARVERATPFNSAPFRVEPPACTSPPLSFQTYVAYSLSLQPVYSMYVWLLTCNLLEKIFYLFGMVSVLNTDCTVMFYVMRRTKLNPTCIYFKNILN